jgi:hypothetical protein
MERRSGTEALAAFRTAPCEHLTAALGRHARAKSMRTGTMQVTRVEGTFHEALSGKTIGQINALGDLREAARVLTEPGSVNRRN